MGDSFKDQNNNKDCSSELIDPDPLTLVSIILGSVSAASTIYSVYAQQSEMAVEKKKRRAEILRWEASLEEFDDVVDDVARFFEDTTKFINQEVMKKPLVPLENQLMLDPKSFKRYRKLVDQLFTHGKRLADATLDLLPHIGDSNLGKILEINPKYIQENLIKLKQMDSVDEALQSARNVLFTLKKTAAFLRERVANESK